MVAFDILLDDLFQEIQRVGPSENSRVIIFSRENQLYVPESSNQSPHFQSIAKADDPLVRNAVATWKRDQPFFHRAFSVSSEGRKWWCGYRPLENTNRAVWVGVMIPEADITGGINNRRAGLWLVAISVVAVAAGLAFWLNRRYRRSFDDPGDRFDPLDPGAVCAG